ncbi:MAG: hypothetical protein OER97_08180 [Gammaproteobacteria bacterium]|nr:hypothetical protein [Gammaproteobacteria bacterium]
MRRKFVAAALVLLGFTAGIAATPKMLDPVHVAPHIYQLAFENEKVRVLKRTIRNGETSPLVSQPDRVVIYLNPCAWMEDDGKRGERMRDYKFGEPTWVKANSHGGDTANVIQQCSVLEIELL